MRRSLSALLLLASTALGLAAPAAQASYSLCGDVYNASGEKTNECINVGDASPVRVNYAKKLLGHFAKLKPTRQGPQISDPLMTGEPGGTR